MLQQFLVVCVCLGLGERAAVNILAADFRQANSLQEVGHVALLFTFLKGWSAVLAVSDDSGFVDGHVLRVDGVYALVRAREYCEQPNIIYACVLVPSC